MPPKSSKSDEPQQGAVAEKVSDATFATSPGEIRELGPDEKPDPTTIAHEEVLPERE